MKQYMLVKKIVDDEFDGKDNFTKRLNELAKEGWRIIPETYQQEAEYNHIIMEREK